MEIVQAPAPRGTFLASSVNQTNRMRRIDLIVIHIMRGREQRREVWLANPKSHLSSHYAVSKRGKVYQYVEDKDLAYHADIPLPYFWAQQRMNLHPGYSPNLFSLGIEVQGIIGDDWPETQVQALTDLIGLKCFEYRIPATDRHIIPHRDIFDGHICPGPTAPMRRIVELSKTKLDLLVAGS